MASSNQGSGSKRSGSSAKQGGTPEQPDEAGKQSDQGSAKGSSDKAVVPVKAPVARVTIPAAFRAARLNNMPRLVTRATKTTAKRKQSC